MLGKGGERFKKRLNLNFVSGGRRVFREFLRCEYSEENILFWMACEDLKKETSPEKVEEKARMIYEDYVSILSPREVFCLLINCTLLCKGCWLNYENCLQLKLRIERRTSVLWNLQLLFPFNNSFICNGRKKNWSLCGLDFSLDHNKSTESHKWTALWLHLPNVQFGINRFNSFIFHIWSSLQLLLLSHTLSIKCDCFQPHYISCCCYITQLTITDVMEEANNECTVTISTDQN